MSDDAVKARDLRAVAEYEATLEELIKQNIYVSAIMARGRCTRAQFVAVAEEAYDHAVSVSERRTAKILRQLEADAAVGTGQEDDRG